MLISLMKHHLVSSKPRDLLPIIIYSTCSLLIGLTMTACGVRPMLPHERVEVEQMIAEQSDLLVKTRTLPKGVPLREIELIRVILKAHRLTERYLPFFITTSDLTSQSVRRLEHGKVGDLIIFRRLPRTLPLAVVTHVMSSTRYRAVGILRGEIRHIELDLATPDKRRRSGTVINTAIRSIQPNDSPPYLYLAGELFSEFRSLF